MPALMTENMNIANINGLEDPMALNQMSQLAFELSKLGINPNETIIPQPPNDSSPDIVWQSVDDREDLNKSGNMTECVPVPTSEHVAEIVGRQGCKIKALRAKTNTYIKTPVRGEEPVFVITGRKDDVLLAKDEIVAAAEHFSHIRAQRRAQNGGPPSPSIPGQVTKQVRVPYRVVGLVVGPKGATIKRIQQETHTYIVTPSRDKEPVFDVTGLPENVEKAKEEIESHIRNRTGQSLSDEESDIHSSGSSGFHEPHEHQDIEVVKMDPLPSHMNQNHPDQMRLSESGSFDMLSNLTNGSVWSTNDSLSLYNGTGYVPRRSGSLGSNPIPPQGDDYGHNLLRRFGSDPLHDGLICPAVNATSPSIEQQQLPIPSSAASFSVCPPFIPFAAPGMSQQSPMGGMPRMVYPTTPNKIITGPTEALPIQMCMICNEKEATTTLLPCGHTPLCGECLSTKEDNLCPTCHQPISQMLSAPLPPLQC